MPKSKDKTIKYNNILLNQNNNNIKSTSDSVDFDQIVSLQNKNSSQEKPRTWSKLDKMSKIDKINSFVKTYSSEHKLTPTKRTSLQKYLRECLDRRKLNRVKDVI